MASKKEEKLAATRKRAPLHFYGILAQTQGVLYVIANEVKQSRKIAQLVPSIGRNPTPSLLWLRPTITERERYALVNWMLALSGLGISKV